MPTVIYDRDNPKGRPAGGNETSSGVIIYAHDESTGKVEATLDGVPMIAGGPAIVPPEPVYEKPVPEQPKAKK